MHTLLKLPIILVYSLLSISWVQTAMAAGDPSRGSELAADCAACHGFDGNSPSPAFPIIAGQHEAYLYTALIAYRDRTRDNAIMSATIVGASDKDLEDLAAWFASQAGLAVASAELILPLEGESATAAGALLSQGGIVVNALATGLPDPQQCPDGSAELDSDSDGLADAFDAQPSDANEFVLDTNSDGRFEICTIEQLQAILTLGEQSGSKTGLSREARMSRDYELVKDIDATSIANFQPIGNCGPTGNCMNDLDKYGFKGSFDGRGYAIINLTIDAPDVGGVGLFGVVSSGKIIRNIELVNATTRGRAGTGTVVGSNFGTVYNCHATGSVQGKYAIGGLVGANAGNISWSHANVTVTGEMAVGGLVGDQNASIFASYAEGAVSGDRGVGGLVGLNTRGRIVSSFATGTVSGGKDVGGLAGLNTDALVANSYATGNVSGSDMNTGGLVGFNSLSKINNVYASGAVNGKTAVGGIAGNNNGSIVHAYSVSPVRGESDAGGLIGNNSGARIVRSYWDADGSRQSNSVGAGKSDYQDATALSRSALQILDGPVSGWLPTRSTSVENYALYYCDRDGSGIIEAGETVTENLVWDFGGSGKLPVIRCAPGSVTRQKN